MIRRRQPAMLCAGLLTPHLTPAPPCIVSSVYYLSSPSPKIFSSTDRPSIARVAQVARNLGLGEASVTFGVRVVLAIRSLNPHQWAVHNRWHERRAATVCRSAVRLLCDVFRLQAAPTARPGPAETHGAGRPESLARTNPVKAGLVQRAEDWRWSSARWYTHRQTVGVPISWID